MAKSDYENAFDEATADENTGGGGDDDAAAGGAPGDETDDTGGEPGSAGADTGEAGGGEGEGAPGSPSLVIAVGSPKGGAPEGSPAEEAGETPAAEAAEDKGAPEGSAAEEASETPAEEAKEEAAEKTGSQAGDAAIKMLRENFGDELADGILALIDSRIADHGGKIDQLGKRMDDMASAVQNSWRHLHATGVLSAHEDAAEIMNSDDFVKYLDGLDPDKQAIASKILKQGTYPQVVALLNMYKKSIGEAPIKPDAAAAANATPPSKEDMFNAAADEGANSMQATPSGTGAGAMALPPKVGGEGGGGSYEDIFNQAADELSQQKPPVGGPGQRRM